MGERGTKEPRKRITRRELLKGAGVLAGASALGYGAWVLGNLPDNMRNIYEGGLSSSVEISEIERKKWIEKINHHLVRSADFKQMAKKEKVDVNDRSEMWSNGIIDAMGRAGVEVDEERLKLALILLHRESRLEVDPHIDMTHTYERYRKEIDRRINEIAPEQGKVRDYLEGQVAAFEEDYGERIRDARTEGELDAVMAELRAKIQPAIDGAYTFLPTDKVHSLWREMNGKLRVSTLGALQVSVNAAIQYYRARGEKNITEEEARKRLLTMDGNLEVGFALFFMGYNQYEGQKDQLRFAFADYNSGPYSSRNAGFQHMVAELSGQSLVLDGDCLMYDGMTTRNDISQTESAVKSAFRFSVFRHNKWVDEEEKEYSLVGAEIYNPNTRTVYERTNERIRDFLVLEKTELFNRDPSYYRIGELYERKTNEPSILAEIPSAADEDARLKYGRDFNTKDYVDESMEFVDRFHW
ncbi:MAG: DUF1615 family protein [Patescibacteria group bacterium]|jgi:hypothetical protein